MPESLDIDYLKPFIESTIDAAARFRRVLVVMITASILGFGAAWNSTGASWYNSRLVLTRSAAKYLTLRDISLRLAQIERASDDQNSEKNLGPDKRKLDEERERILQDTNHILRIDDQDDQKEDKLVSHATDLEEELKSNDYKKAREWIKLRRFNDAAQATRYAQSLDEARTTNLILLHIPFFGNVFDVNDLGLLGGVTFTVILLMFRFTLWREHNNLRSTFLEAKPEHLEYCYKSLAMQQVLTVPPTLPKIQPHLEPWGKIVRGLYFFPLLVQLIILINDADTIKIGSVLNPKATTIGMTASSLAFFFIVVLTVMCVQLSALIDKEWKYWEQRAGRASQKSQAWAGPF